MKFSRKLTLSIFIPLVLVVITAIIIQNIAISDLYDNLEKTMEAVRAGASIQTVQSTIEFAKSQLKKTLWMSIGVMTIVAGVSGVIGFRIMNSVMKPVSEMAKVAEEIADGKLSHAGELISRIKYREKDEIGKLLEGFRAISTEVLQTLEVITDRMEKISKGDVTEELTLHAKGDFESILNSMRKTIVQLRNLMKTVRDLAVTLETRADDLARISSEITEAVNQVAEPYSR